jgi:hypothetical protein
MPISAIVSASFTRPADTTAYASGDLVANSTTAGSVVAMKLDIGRANGLGGVINRVRVSKTGTSVTNASFRVHLFNANSQTFANGDNGAWSVNKAANYIGSVDVTVDKAFTDGAAGVAGIAPGIQFAEATLYGNLEARGAYTPASAEVFTITLEGAN